MKSTVIRCLVAVALLSTQVGMLMANDTPVASVAKPSQAAGQASVVQHYYTARHVVHHHKKSLWEYPKTDMRRFGTH